MTLEEQFIKRVGYKPNFKEPRTFNEKIGYRKLYDHKDEHVVMCDKLASKELAQGRCPGLKVHKTLWQGDDPNMIIFKPPCMVKVNAGSGRNIAVADPVSYVQRVDIVRKLQAYKSKGYGEDKGEWGYSKVMWKAFTEEYEVRPFRDIKFFVFSGQVKIVNLLSYAPGHVLTNCSYFGPDGTFIEVSNGKYPVVDKKLKLRKEALTNGIRIAEECAAGCDFVRVDLYYIEEDDEWVFGEYTLYPTSGMAAFPKAFDEELGSYWRLP